MYVVLIGAPASGKGTQAKELAEACELAHVATGDLFREAVQRGTELGRRAKLYMDRGELVADALTIAMVIERLEEPDARPGAILDGFPRTLEQARALDEALAARQQRIARAIYLKVPTEALLRRLSGRWICLHCQATFHELYQPPASTGRCDRCGGELYQRPDDQPATARHRLEVYFEHTLPVIEYYRGRSVLVEVDGDQSIQEVREDLLRVFGKVAA